MFCMIDKYNHLNTVMKVILILEIIDLSHLMVKNHLHTLSVSIHVYNNILKQPVKIHMEEKIL